MSVALLEHATHTIAVGSKSFAAAARLFAPEVRRSVLMLYAWCRHCDDVVDGQELGFTAVAQDAGAAAAALARLEAQTRQAYAGEPMQEPPLPPSRSGAALRDRAATCVRPPGRVCDGRAGSAL